MQVQEAKDFLVQQIVQQAQLENIHLSDLEVHMLRITEEERGEDEYTPFEAEFYSRYDNQQYERKISQLLNHARKRYKRETPGGAQFWDGSIQTLSQGNHYLLYLWDKSHARVDFIKDRVKLLGIGLLLLFVLLLLIIVAMILDDSHSPAAQGHFPVGLQRSVLGVIGTMYLLFLLFPRKIGRVFEPVLDKVAYVLIKLFGDKGR